MANNKVVPVVALARRAINDLVAFEDAVTRSVAALSTYVAEGNVERARSESRFIRGRVEADLDKFRRVLHDILQEAKKDSVDRRVLREEIAELRKKALEVAEEEMSFSQAMDEVDPEAENADIAQPSQEESQDMSRE